MRIRSVFSVLGLGAIIATTVAAPQSTAVTKAPKAGAACATKDVGKRSGSLVCTKSGTKAAWRSAPTTTKAPAAPAPAPAAPAPAPAAPAPAPAAPKEIKSVTATVAAAYTNLPVLAPSIKVSTRRTGSRSNRSRSLPVPILREA